MNKNIKVSVIIPTFNDSIHIRKAIDSVLNQTFKNFEIIVIDDGSADNTKDLLLDYIKSNKIIYKYQENSGVRIARNNGILISKGLYIAFLDSDDEWIDNDKLLNQVNFFDNNLDYVLVGTGVVLIDILGKEITRYNMPETDKNIREKLLRINCFVNSSVLFRRNAINIIGNSDSILEDYDLWLRLGSMGKIANLPEYSVGYLIKTKGVNTKNKILRLKENLLLTKKYKDIYPGYWKALIFGYLKIFFYPLFYVLPSSISGFLLKIHKKL